MYRIAISGFVLFAMAAETIGDVPPHNSPPELWRASAAERRGKVVIQISRPKYQVPRVAGPAEAMKWDYLEKVPLGKEIQAYDVHGNRLSADAVLQALKRPVGVVVFSRLYRPLLEPDPFYLRMIREGTVVLVVAADAIAPPIP